MKVTVLFIVMLSIACMAAATQKESGDMRTALGAGFAIPTFDRSGMNWQARGNFAIFPFLTIAPEVGWGGGTCKPPAPSFYRLTNPTASHGSIAKTWLPSI